MQQNEHEYLKTLKDRLTGHVSQEDLDDILSDYAEHFSIGKSEGRSEEDLCRALGSPDDVAREFRASYLVKQAEQSRSAGNIWSAVMATLGLGLFNLAVVLIPFIILIALLTVIFVAGVLMVILGPILLLVSILQMLGITLCHSLVVAPGRDLHLCRDLGCRGIPGHGRIVPCAVLLPGWYPVPQMEYQDYTGRGRTGPGRGALPDHHHDPKGRCENLELQVRFGAGELAIREGTGGQNLVDLATRTARPVHGRP